MSKTNIRKMSTERALRAYFPKLTAAELAALDASERAELGSLAKAALLERAAA